MVAADLWEWNQPIHFVVLPIDEKSALAADTLSRALARKGLQAVFFDNCDGNYAGLDQLLEEAVERGRLDKSVPTSMAGRSAQTKTSVPSDQTQPATQVRAPDEEAQLQWLEEVNKTTAKHLRKNED